MAKTTLYHRLDKKIQKVSATVGALVIIVGALTGVFSWISGQFTNAISSQIDEFRQEVKTSNDSQDLAIMRLELMNLIQNDPENVVEIEMLGKKYFEAGGNSYVSRYFSAWAKEYGGDASIVVGGK